MSSKITITPSLYWTILLKLQGMENSNLIKFIQMREKRSLLLNLYFWDKDSIFFFKKGPSQSDFTKNLDFKTWSISSESVYQYYMVSKIYLNRNVTLAQHQKTMGSIQQNKAIENEDISFSPLTVTKAEMKST